MEQFKEASVIQLGRLLRVINYYEHHTQEAHPWTGCLHGLTGKRKHQRKQQQPNTQSVTGKN